MNCKVNQLLLLALLGVAVGNVHADYIDEEEGIISYGNGDLPVVTPVPVDNNSLPLDGEPPAASKQSRNAISSKYMRWPRGVVPYTIHDNFPDSLKTNIEDAMRDLEESVNKPGSAKKCIEFVKWSSEGSHVNIVPSNRSCASSVGRVEDHQELYLKSTCAKKRGVVMHELIHALGFYHEMSRDDRDKYIDMFFENVKDDKKYDYKIYSSRYMAPPEHTYDFDSLVQYECFAAAKDPTKPTSTAQELKKDKVKVKMGQRYSMSETDVIKIQSLYGCELDSSHIKNLDRVRSNFCNFEHGPCQWKIDTSKGLFDWRIRRGSSESGPNWDATMGIGHYLIASAAGHRGKKARLVGPEMPKKGPFCLDVHFFYDNQNEDSEITIRTRTNKQKNYHTEWIYKGRSTLRWWRVLFTMDKPRGKGKNFRLAIEVKMGARDIAIDDIYIHPGKCDG